MRYHSGSYPFSMGRQEYVKLISGKSKLCRASKKIINYLPGMVS